MGGGSGGKPFYRALVAQDCGSASRENKGQPDVHFHDLRHAAATLAVQSGATLKDTMARLGHSTPRAALIYQHTAADRDEAIAQALGAEYESQVVTRSKRGTRGEVSPDWRAAEEATPSPIPNRRYRRYRSRRRPI